MIQEGKMPSLSVHISMNMTKLRSHTVCNTSTHVNTALDRGVMMRMTHTESGVLGHLGQLHPVVSEVVHQDHQRSDPDNMAWSQTSEGVTTVPDLNICVVQLSVRRARVARW